MFFFQVKESYLVHQQPTFRAMQNNSLIIIKKMMMMMMTLCMALIMFILLFNQYSYLRIVKVPLFHNWYLCTYIFHTLNTTTIMEINYFKIVLTIIEIIGYIQGLLQLYQVILNILRTNCMALM